MPISQDVLNLLRENEKLQFTIAQGMNKKFRTVEKWVRENDEMLASKAVVLIIREETGLTEEQIVEPATASAL